MQRPSLKKDLLLFACSALIFASILAWIFGSTGMQKIRDVSESYQRLVLQGKIDEAKELVAKNLNSNDGPLDPDWIGLVRRLNGYDQLSYFLRMLAAEPESEEIYQELGELVRVAPEAFHQEIKGDYMQRIYAIEGIVPEFVELHIK